MDAEVAVKVQRPGIRATVEQDLDILQRLAVRLERRARWARAVGAVGVARGFAAAMREELDFRVEARNTAAVAANWAGQQRAVKGSVSVTLPAVHEQLCTEHVLVIEWLDGLSLRAAGPLINDRGLDRTALSRALLRSMVYQITEGGVFHADPHPGNVMLLTDGSLALLDFGSVGRLDARQRLALQDLLLALGRGDPAAFGDALLELVTRAEEIDELLLERALGQFMARHLEGGAAATPEMFTDLFRLASRFELAIPPEIATVLRALGTLEGTLSLLTPGVDIAAEAHAYAADQVAGRMSPKAVQKTVADELAELLPVMPRAATPVRPRHRRAGAGQARPQRTAIGRRTGPAGGHRPDPSVPPDVPRRGIRHRRGTAARRARWPQGHPHRQPLPDNRLQPAHPRRHPRPASTVHDLEESVTHLSRTKSNLAIDSAGGAPHLVQLMKSQLTGGPVGDDAVGPGG